MASQPHNVLRSLKRSCAPEASGARAVYGAVAMEPLCGGMCVSGTGVSATQGNIISGTFVFALQRIRVPQSVGALLDELLE